MKTMKEFLKKNYRTNEMPQWLDEYDGNRVDIAAIRNTACVFYPGSGNDGQPIHTFNAGHIELAKSVGVRVLFFGTIVLAFTGIQILAMHIK